MKEQPPERCHYPELFADLNRGHVEWIHSSNKWNHRKYIEDEGMQPAPDGEAGLQLLNQGGCILSILLHQLSTQSLASNPNESKSPLNFY